MTVPQLKDYLWNTEPWAKQQEAFAAALDQTSNPYYPLFALFMEQRTGKAITSIGLISYRYQQGEIDAAMVIAMPSGVPINWRDELLGTPNNRPPRRLPPDVPCMAVVWDAGRARSVKSYQAELEELLNYGGLAALLVNGEAVITDTFRAYARKFLKKRRTAVFYDETSLVAASPGNARSKILRSVSGYTPYRMILDGTPAGESPLAMYSQMALLDTAILGPENFATFKAKYAVYEKKMNHTQMREYQELQSFQNLDEMAERLTPVSFRCTRKECYDIPEKIYKPYIFDLSPEQQRVYDELSERYETELSSGKNVDARMILTRYMRLQQVTSNFWPSEIELIICPDCKGSGCAECDDLGGIPSKTPPEVIDKRHDTRLEAFAEVLSVEHGPLIVWARFTSDIDKIISASRDLGRRPVRYDGLVNSATKYKNLQMFQGGEADIIAAKQASMQRGVNAGAAEAHVFYSNTFSGIIRQQAEDRTEVSGRTKGTGIIDLAARGTIDEEMIDAHRSKLSISEIVMARRQRRAAP